MTQNAANDIIVEQACKDIDQYLSDQSAHPSSRPLLLSPSERLRALARPRPQPGAEQGPLVTNKF